MTITDDTEIGAQEDVSWFALSWETLCRWSTDEGPYDDDDQED